MSELNIRSPKLCFLQRLLNIIASMEEADKGKFRTKTRLLVIFLHEVVMIVFLTS